MPCRASKASPVLLRIAPLRMFMVLLPIYALSTSFQIFIGNGDFVMEEVVIVHEHDTEEEATKATAAQSRGKKQKAQ